MTRVHVCFSFSVEFSPSVEEKAAICEYLSSRDSNGFDWIQEQIRFYMPKFSHSGPIESLGNHLEPNLLSISAIRQQLCFPLMKSDEKCSSSFGKLDFGKLTLHAKLNIMSGFVSLSVKILQWLCC